MQAGQGPQFVRPGGRSGLDLGLQFSGALTCSALFLGALLAGATPGRILQALTQMRPEWLTLALMGVGLAFALRAQRWAVMLRRCGTQLRFRDAAVPLIGAAALDNLVPCGAGAAIRLIALQSFEGRLTLQQLGTLAWEKRFDAAALVAIGLATLALAGPSQFGSDLPRTIGLLACALALALMLQLGAGSRSRTASVRLRELERTPSGELLAWRAFPPRRPTLLAAIAGLGLAAWLAEGLTAVAAAQALGLAKPLATAALAVSLGGLARFAPSLPGHVGPFDYFLASAAVAGGAGKDTAIAYAVLVHVLIWLPTTVTGWLLLIDSARIGVLRGPRPAQGS